MNNHLRQTHMQACLFSLLGTDKAHDGKLNTIQVAESVTVGYKSLLTYSTINYNFCANKTGFETKSTYDFYYNYSSEKVKTEKSC